jgi:hypothetical protein
MKTEAERHMATVNSGTVPAERIVTIGDFVEQVYLPWTAVSIFANSLGKALSLSSVVNRVICFAVNRCESCGKAESDHRKAGHPYRRERWHHRVARLARSPARTGKQPIPPRCAGNGDPANPETRERQHSLLLLFWTPRLQSGMASKLNP